MKFCAESLKVFINGNRNNIAAFKGINQDFPKLH